MSDQEQIKFLSEEDVIAIHRNTIQTEGGGDGVRDIGLMHAAVSMPRQSFAGEYLHPDIPSMAAAYHFHLAQNHPFVDGNKRVSIAGALLFLRANGYAVNATEDDLYDITIRVASGQIDKRALTNWCRERITR
jgi:death on curing protein